MRILARARWVCFVTGDLARDVACGCIRLHWVSSGCTEHGFDWVCFNGAKPTSSPWALRSSIVHALRRPSISGLHQYPGQLRCGAQIAQLKLPKSQNLPENPA
jgi:hypothetical protein